MAGKYDSISSSYVKKMLNNNFKAKLYAEEIKKIREDYHLDEKEKFIKEANESFKTDKFADELATTLRCYYSSFSTYGLSDKFEEIIERYGGSVDALYYPISNGEIKILGDKQFYYMYDEHVVGWDVEKSCVLTIPTDIDIFSFISDLEELYDEAHIRYEDAMKKKKEEEYKEKILAERREREEYLRLREKYGYI